MKVKLSIIAAGAMNALGVATVAVQTVGLMTTTINAVRSSVVGVSQLDAPGVGHLKTMPRTKMDLLKEEVITDTPLVGVVIDVIGVILGRSARRKSSAMRHMNYTRRRRRRSRLKLKKLPPPSSKASMSFLSPEKSALKTSRTLNASLSFKTFHCRNQKRILCSTSSVF